MPYKQMFFGRWRHFLLFYPKEEGEDADSTDQGGGAGFYRIISRVVDRRRVLDQDEKERFRTILRAMEAFSGCEILTYTAERHHAVTRFRLNPSRPHLHQLFQQKESAQTIGIPAESDFLAPCPSD